MSKRLMIFVDGDNLLARFQAMKSQGHVPHPKVVHREDDFVWTPRFDVPYTGPVSTYYLVRATYYCSVTGSHEKVAEVTEGLKAVHAKSGSNSGVFGGLTPVVFKKESRKDKASGVDVRLASDALGHIFRGNMDLISIVSGDGDFLPVAQEAVRHGVHVHVAALSSGLNSEWRRAADVFTDLDQYFFTDHRTGE